MPYAHMESIIHSCKVCLAAATVRIMTMYGGSHGYFCDEHGREEVENLNRQEAEYHAAINGRCSSEDGGV